MSIVRIEEDRTASIDRANKLLAGISGGAWKAAKNAVDRAAATAKTRAGQFAASEYTVNKGDFMGNVRVSTKVDSSGGSAVSVDVGFFGKVLPLLTFNTRLSKDGQITTQVKRNGGAATLQHAFAERVFGQIAVFERVGTPRFPVEQKFGPSTAHMMQNEQVVEKMDEAIRDTFEKRMEHEVTRILNGWGR